MAACDAPEETRLSREMLPVFYAVPDSTFNPDRCPLIDGEPDSNLIAVAEA